MARANSNITITGVRFCKKMEVPEFTVKKE